LSSATHSANIIVEWSAHRITVYDVPSQQIKSYAAAESLPYAGKTAILAISRKSIFVRSTRVPNAAPEEIRLVVQVKLAELFPIPARDLAYDFMLLSDVNAEGRLALIMAMPVLELRRAYEKMAASGIKIARTLPLAIAAPLVAESVGFHDAAVVEGNDEFASVDLVAGGILRYSRVVPPGAILDVEVSRTYNASGLAGEKVIAAGGIRFSGADSTTSFSALQALATAAADRYKVNIELPEVVAARELTGRRRRSAISFSFLAFAVAAAYYAYYSRADLQSRGDSQVAKAKKSLDAATKNLKVAEDNSNRQAAITQILDGAFHPAQLASDIVALAANSAPEGVWLNALSVERGKELALRGYAIQNDAVSTYVSNLNDYVDPESGQPRFRNAKMLLAQNAEVEKNPVDQFSISAFPNGNLPLALQQKTGLSTTTH
jgi:Tfp pilus assembly PilM family ATPase